MAAPLYLEFIASTTKGATYVNTSDNFVLVTGFNASAAFAADGDFVEVLNSSDTIISKMRIFHFGTAASEIVIQPVPFLIPPGGYILTSEGLIQMQALAGSIEDLRGYSV